MLNSKDKNKIIEIFANDMIVLLCNSEDWVVKKFAVSFIRTDLAFDPQECPGKTEPSDCGTYAQNHLEEIVWKSKTIEDLQ